MYVNENDDLWYSIDDNNPFFQELWCYSIVFNKNGNIMISCSGRYLKVWKFENGKLSYDKQRFILKAHQQDINTLSYSQQQNMFISGGDDQKLKVWLMNANQVFQMQQEIQTQSMIISSLLKTDDSQLFVGFWNGLLQIYNKNGNNYLLHHDIVCHTAQIYSISLNDSQNQILTQGWDKKLVILQFEGGKWTESTNIVVEKNGFRASFICNNQIVFQPLHEGGIEFYQFSQNNKIIEKSNLYLNLEQIIGDQNLDDRAFFNIQMNQQKGQFTIKQNKKVHLIQRVSQDKFEIIQQINLQDNKAFGAVTSNFDYLVIWEKSQNRYEIKKL